MCVFFSILVCAGVCAFVCFCTKEALGHGFLVHGTCSRAATGRTYRCPLHAARIPGFPPGCWSVKVGADGQGVRKTCEKHFKENHIAIEDMVSESYVAFVKQLHSKNSQKKQCVCITLLQLVVTKCQCLRVAALWIAAQRRAGTRQVVSH